MPTPVITLGKNPLQIADLGGENWYIKTVTDLSGAGTDTYATGFVRENFEYTPNSTVNTKTSEGGIKRTTSTYYDYGFKITSQEVHPSIWDAFPKAIKGKLCIAILELNQDPINGKFYYGAFLIRITKWPGLKPKGSLDFEFEGLQATADITLTMDATTFPIFQGTFATTTIVIAKGYPAGYIAV